MSEERLNDMIQQLQIRVSYLESELRDLKEYLIKNGVFDNTRKISESQTQLQLIDLNIEC